MTLVEPCALKQLLVCSSIPSQLKRDIEQAIAAGFTLRTSLSAIDQSVLTEWLGGRWWFLHHSQLRTIEQWTAVVCSRLSRTAPGFAQWPALIDRLVRSLVRDQRIILLVPQTTSFKMLAPLAAQWGLPCLHVDAPELARSRIGKSLRMIDWMQQTLTTSREKSVAQATLFVSPAFSAADSRFEGWPLQDRLATSLAHRVIALSVRPGGNSAALLQQRLHDDRFALGTVAVRLASDTSPETRQWLDHRAYGIIWTQTAQVGLQYGQRTAFGCRPTVADPDIALTQWTASANLLGNLEDYLVHCVRAGHGSSLRHGDRQAFLDAVIDGQLMSASPLRTLMQIVNQGRLRASQNLLRSSVSAVSFSAVPMPELVQRRRYQSHLGRWDWEPYGLLIRRDVLQQLGARPVTYGDNETYAQLDEDSKAFFQPARRRRARHEQDHWQAEQEWRLLGDVRLQELPRGSVLLFVDTPAEAQILAARCGWPVIWRQAHQTLPSPTCAVRSQRSLYRINRN